MTEKDLQRMRRQELAEMAASLTDEVDTLRTRLEDRESKLKAVAQGAMRQKKKLTEQTETAATLEAALRKALAQRDALAAELREKDAALADRDRQLQALRAELDEKTVSLAGREDDWLRQRLQETQAELGRVRQDAAEKEALLRRQQGRKASQAELDAVIVEFEATTAELRARLKDRDGQVERLYRQLEQKDAALRDIRGEIQTWRGAQKQEQERAIQERDARIRELSEKLDRKEGEVRELWGRLWDLVSPDKKEQ